MKNLLKKVNFLKFETIIKEQKHKQKWMCWGLIKVERIKRVENKRISQPIFGVYEYNIKMISDGCWGRVRVERMIEKDWKIENKN